LGNPQPFAPSRLRVRLLPLLPDDRLHLQILNFRFSHFPSPQALDSQLPSLDSIALSP
jgi:hypothetical protein